MYSRDSIDLSTIRTRVIVDSDNDALPLSYKIIIMYNLKHKINNYYSLLIFNVIKDLCNNSCNYNF